MAVINAGARFALALVHARILSLDAKVTRVILIRGKRHPPEICRALSSRSKSSKQNLSQNFASLFSAQKRQRPLCTGSFFFEAESDCFKKKSQFSCARSISSAIFKLSSIFLLAHRKTCVLLSHLCRR